MTEILHVVPRAEARRTAVDAAAGWALVDASAVGLLVDASHVSVAVTAGIGVVASTLMVVSSLLRWYRWGAS